MKQLLILSTFIFAFTFQTQAQSKRNDIRITALPTEVKAILIQYINILKNASSLEDCASKFTKVAGGGLINENPDYITLRSSVKPYSLKKDYNNIKFYANPLIITRVNLTPSRSSGYGMSAVKGKMYKIWIKKKDGVNGMPAPISIIVPENHDVFKRPQVIGIGSL